MKLKELQKVILAPNVWVYRIIRKYPFLIKDDRKYIEYVWKKKMGYPLDLDHPRTFNEKMQWLKLYDRRPEFTSMVDKFAVKEYVAKKIGPEYVIPTLGVWDRTEDIEWDILPNQFVLKCTHDSGGLVICKDKNKLDKNKAINKLKRCLRHDFYLYGREWPYKDVPHRIIAEQYIEGDNGELNDYKVFNFNGEPRIIQIDYDRFKGHQRNLYTTEWDRIHATIEYPTDENRNFSKPIVLDELIALCRKLSEGRPFLRTDFYIVNNRIYFGELTFFHGSGLELFTPQEFDEQLGSWITLV